MSAQRNCASISDSKGTSSSSRGMVGQPVTGEPSALVAVSNNEARSLAPASFRRMSTRSSKAARSVPLRGSRAKSPLATAASLKSSSVRASALGKPGVWETGEKYWSASSLRASNAARVATASCPSVVVGARSRAASSMTASRAASCVKESRCSPNVAPLSSAIARARSSTEPRDAPRSSTSAPGSNWSRNRRASRRRTAADPD